MSEKLGSVLQMMQNTIDTFNKYMLVPGVDYLLIKFGLFNIAMALSMNLVFVASAAINV